MNWTFACQSRREGFEIVIYLTTVELFILEKTRSSAGQMYSSNSSVNYLTLWCEKYTHSGLCVFSLKKASHHFWLILRFPKHVWHTLKKKPFKIWRNLTFACVYWLFSVYRSLQFVSLISLFHSTNSRFVQKHYIAVFIFEHSRSVCAVSRCPDQWIRAYVSPYNLSVNVRTYMSTIRIAHTMRLIINHLWANSVRKTTH